MIPLTPPQSLINVPDHVLRNESDRGFTRIYQAVNQINQHVGLFSDAEVPTPGPPNGVMKVFGLAHTPAPSASLRLYLDTGTGGMLVSNYALKGNIITFTVAPAVGTLAAFYRYQE